MKEKHIRKTVTGSFIFEKREMINGTILFINKNYPTTDLYLRIK